MKKYLWVYLIFFNAVIGNLTAQTCGFGCLGLSGAFAGYSYQSVNMDNLNNALVFENNKFGSLTGYRFGVNLFRAQFDDFFVSIKGYYQILEQEETATGNLENIGNYDVSYKVQINNYGVGLDFGIPFSEMIDFKIVEAGLTFNDATYINKVNSQNFNDELKFTNSGTDMGYYLGTGFIFNIIKSYVSVEVSLYYSHIKISKMITDNGVSLLDKSDFVNSGDIGYTLQLNIGLPF